MLTPNSSQLLGTCAMFTVMPRARRESGARRNNLGVALTDEEMIMLRRIADRYGHSMSSAARMLILAAAPDHDPEQRKS